MINFPSKPNTVPTQGTTTNEAANASKEVGKSKRRNLKTTVEGLFTLVFSSACIAGLLFVDKQLLAGTLGSTIWDEFGEGGLAVYIPFALVMIAAFAHRLISKQSDDELKKSWLGKLVKRLCTLLLFSIAILFSTTMLKNLHPAAAVSAGSGWGAASEVAKDVIETKVAAFAALISPFADTLFALVSGGILIINAFILMILMDWWFSALKALIVGRSEHKALMQANEELKDQRKRYSNIAATLNVEAAKTPLDREMEFALFIASQGLKALAAQRKALSDRKIKSRIKNPNWQEVGETTLSEDPAELLKQRKDFERALNIDAILTIIQRPQS